MIEFPPSKKQVEVFNHATADLNILTGSITSGKTHETNFMFALDMLGVRHKAPPGDFVILGQTRGIAYRNVVEPILERFPGVAYVREIQGILYLFLGKRRARVGGVENREAFRKFLGGPNAGGLIDELTKIPEWAFNQIYGRCSEGGRIYATTNPDSKFHWVYKRFIEVKQDPDRVMVFFFELADNPTLSKTQIEKLKSKFVGLWYKRYILGLWVAAEGAIYDMWDEDVHTFSWDDEDEYTGKKFARFVPDEVAYGVDYATSAPCVYLPTYHKGNIAYVVGEWYYDSVAQGRQMTNSQYKDKAIKVQDDYGEGTFVIDPSATSLKTEFTYGDLSVISGNNDVDAGIQLIATILQKKKYFVHKSCDNLIKEFPGYVWDPKAQARGEDKPLKKDDHCLTGDTIVNTVDGDYPIKELCGKKKNIYCFDEKNDCITQSIGYNIRKTRANVAVYEVETVDGRKFKATADHLILTLEGWKMVKDLTENDEIVDVGKQEVRYSEGYAFVDGHQFKKDNKIGYYLSTYKIEHKGRMRLHRYMYLTRVGNIPEDYEVHHKDMDKSNNEISNLELMTEHEHRKYHGCNMSEETKEKLRKHLIEKAVPKSKAWHRSEEGRKWHSNHAKEVAKNMPTITCVCEVCGVVYTTKANMNYRSKFCSNKCKSTWRRDSGVDNIKVNCIECGREFIKNKYSKTESCSRKCGGKQSSEKRKGKKQKARRL